MNTPSPSDESKLVATAELLLMPLVKADRRRRLQMGILSVVCVGLLVVSVFTVIGFSSSANLVRQQRAGSIASCESGNRARATNREIWDAFISLLLNNPNAANVKAQLEKVGREEGLAPNEFKVLEALLDAEFTVSPESKALGAQFEAFIAQNEQPQDCAKLYGAASSRY